MSKGVDLITQLKQHVLDEMRGEPSCAPGAGGLGNVQIEELCDLALPIDDHKQFLTHSLLRMLVSDGVVEKIIWPGCSSRPKYRLR